MSILIFIREKLYTVFKYIKNPVKLVCDICDYDNNRFAYLIPDKLHLKCLFRKYMGRKLNLSDPQTFSEKLQWLKLYNRKSEYTIMADKAEVKKYIAEKLGREYIIPTIGIYDSVDDVPFDNLPDRYVIKCTHDSGSTFVCKNKADFDVENVKKKLTERLEKNFYWYAREWVYKDIKPRIIVEEFISDESGECPVDYKFFCFNGKMEFFKVDYNRFAKHVANYYKRDCELANIGEATYPPDPGIKLDVPQNFQKMIELVEKISVDIPFLRVDLYSMDNLIYFGELTFYPAGGLGPFTNDGDIVLGRLLNLSNNK